jgi:hypothetical protein
MSQSFTHHDITGQPISVGSYVVYAASAGRSAVLRMGRVTSLGFSKKRNTIYLHGGRTETGNTATLRIKAADKWGDTWTSHRKETTLHFPDRVKVIDELCVPQAAWVAIEDVGRNR